jgi:hypothetical protein
VRRCASLRAAGNVADRVGRHGRPCGAWWWARGQPVKAQGLYERALATAHAHPGPALSRHRRTCTSGWPPFFETPALREHGDLDRRRRSPCRRACDLGDRASFRERTGTAGYKKKNDVGRAAGRAGRPGAAAAAMLEQAAAVVPCPILPRTCGRIAAMKAWVPHTPRAPGRRLRRGRASPGRAIGGPTSYLAEFTHPHTWPAPAHSHQLPSRDQAHPTRTGRGTCPPPCLDRIVLAADAAGRGGADSVVERPRRPPPWAHQEAIDHFDGASSPTWAAQPQPGRGRPDSADSYPRTRDRKMDALLLQALSPRGPTTRAPARRRPSCAWSADGDTSQAPRLCDAGTRFRSRSVNARLEVLRLLATDVTGPEIASGCSCPSTRSGPTPGISSPSST